MRNDNFEEIFILGGVVDLSVTFKKNNFLYIYYINLHHYIYNNI